VARVLAPFFLLLLWVTATAAQGTGGAARFDEGRLAEAIRILSSDEYGGRALASAGEQLTTDYLVARFKQYGLLPANHGSYLQEVPLLQITAVDATMRVDGGPTSLSFAYGSDFVAFTSRPEAAIALSKSALVFAGYGIVAPEYHWNDYAGLDVRGKTVLVMVNDPGYVSDDPRVFRGKEMTYYGRWTYKIEEAARQGAAGVLIVHESGPAGYPWKVVRNSWTGSLAELTPGVEYHPQLQGWLAYEAATKVFAAANLNFAELSRAAARPGFKPVVLKLAATLTLHNQVRSVVSHNVAAVVTGTRSPQEVVVYSAHWDHLGTKPGPDGKPQIFHGAIDNASGVAALLELARVYAQARPAPARSVLFLATTAEEQGLLGAAFYVTHPLFPIKDTVADLNMDIMNPYGKTHDLTVRGRFMSTLDDDLQESARQLGLRVLPDAEPEKGYYFRADHFEFAKAGVAAVSINSGTDYDSRPAGWGLERWKDYISQRYHKPADAYESGWDLAGMGQQMDVVYLTGRKLADSSARPAWFKDSPFHGAQAATP